MKCNYEQVCLDSDIEELKKGQFTLFDKRNKKPTEGKDIILTSCGNVEIYKDQKNFKGVLSHIFIKRH